jgi:hypothetical protein
MSKPTVYLDTNIISELCYRGGNVPNLARQAKTREWWDTERRFFTVVTSGRTEDELAQGDYRDKAAALAAVRRLTFLTETSEVRRCAAVFLETGLVPAAKLLRRNPTGVCHRSSGRLLIDVEPRASGQRGGSAEIGESQPEPGLAVAAACVAGDDPVGNAGPEHPEEG